MGAGWYVARETSGPAVLPHGGRALLFAQFQLEEFARALGLPLLKSYFSSDPAAVAAYFRDQGLDPDAYELPEETWFAASEALPTVRGLCERLETERVPGHDKVKADLTAMLRVMEEADARGERIHIATAMADLSERESPAAR